MEQIVESSESRADSQESSSADHDKRVCRIVWIMNGQQSDEDFLALLSLHAVVAREFASKAVIILQSEGNLENMDTINLCLSQSYSLTNVHYG